MLDISERVGLLTHFIGKLLHWYIVILILIFLYNQVFFFLKRRLLLR